MKILIVEDDTLLLQGLILAAQTEGYACDGVSTARAAEQCLETGHYSLVVLDLGLPDEDGLHFLNRIRQKKYTVPVLILTARDTVKDRVSGLDVGADDYLVKPFNLDELVARVFALRRRSQGWASSELRLGALCVNSRQRQVKLANEEIHLSDREFRLLVALIEMPGSVLSVAQLEERLYGWGEEIASNSIEVQLHRLRRKLGKEWIRNVRGIGFKLVDPAA